jgi:hypothetical protein
VKKLITIGLLSLFLTSTEASEIDWLKSQLRPFGTEASLIQSYQDIPRSYIYDQALAIIAFTEAKKFSEAKKLILGLERLQLKDGSWYFSYYLDGTSPHPAEGDMRPHGAIAWVGLAILTYQKKTADPRFAPVWNKTLNYLSQNLRKVPSFEGEGLIFSSIDNSKTAWNETEIVALEHTLDVYASYRMAYQLTGSKRWLKKQNNVEKFILEMWDQENGHFWPGVNILTGKINRHEFYLDNQSWSALAFVGHPEKEKFQKSLTASCRLTTKSGEQIGFSESRSPASTQDFIWSEGTAGKALALDLYSQSCDNINSETYFRTLNSMSVNGGVRYINKPQVVDFSYSPSVAGTVWTWFLKHKYNPLNT